MDPSLRANSFTVNDDLLKFGLHIESDQKKKQGESQKVPDTTNSAVNDTGSLPEHVADNNSEVIHSEESLNINFRKRIAAVMKNCSDEKLGIVHHY